MRLALIPRDRSVSIDAGACPTRDRTSRADKALAACKDAWSEAYAQAQEKGLPATKALRMAQVAYKLAMPKMDTLPGIRAAIAAIAQGIQLEVFDGRDGSQLLYAAQVALATLKVKGAKKHGTPTPHAT
jgi:hypothetical protein